MRAPLAALALALAPALALAGCATPGGHPAYGPETHLYDPRADAAGEVAAALAAGRARGVPTLIVLGANWCPDSLALAAWRQSPRGAAFLAPRFETVFVDVGRPQTGAGRNAAILAGYGLPAQTGTPLVLVVAPGGAVLNAGSAASWRDAASRSPAAIEAALAPFAPPRPGAG